MAGTSAPYTMTFLSILLLAALGPIASAVPFCGLVPPKLDNVARQQSNATTSNDDVVASAWYPGWLGNTSPPSNISWEKYNSMTFAFAVTTPDASVISLDAISTQVLPTFVSAAHENGVNALVSVGGWTGSLYYSSAVATPANRTIFVKTITDFATKYSLDGIDFDWEYPNKQGIGCNTISPSDSANFLLFLQALRSDPVGSKLMLSAAVGITPFMGPDGTPMTDVSGFGNVLDHIAIMNYDVWGSWDTTVGPNAPLNDSCASAQDGSAVSAVNAWTGANFPANKIVLGVASYGHSFHVATTAALDASGNLTAYPAFDKTMQPLGDSDGTGATSVDQCGNTVGPSGVFNFWGLVQDGFLDTSGNPANGIDFRYDNCSQTPYVYNTTSQVMVSYDDATSFAAKGQFINDNGLKGFSMWHVLGDYSDILIDSISTAMGIEQDCS